MEKGRYYHFLPWALSIMLLYIRNGYAEVSCKAGTFSIGQPGSVTCDFGKDIRKQQQIFKVVQYGLQSPSTANDLLLCNWVSNKPDCIVKDGLSFILSPDDTKLEVNIASVDATMAGTVVCQLGPGDDHGIKPCNVTVCLGGSYISDAQRESVPSASGSFDDIHVKVVLVILAVPAGLFLFCGCPAIVILISARFRYKIVRRNKLANGKMSRGWGDICLCRLFQAGLLRFQVCLNSVDEEAGTKEMCTSTFIEVDSKLVQCTKTAVADMTTNTENEGVHVTVTLHPQGSKTTSAHPILKAVTHLVAEGVITDNGKEQGKDPVADHPIKKTIRKGKRDCDTSTKHSGIPAPAPPHHGKELISNSPFHNIDTKTFTEPQRIESANSVEAMGLKVYDSELTRRPGTMTENADHEENNKSATFEDNERLIFKVEDDVDIDQARALLTSNQPDSSDANKSCQVDELSLMDSEENGDTQGLSRKKRCKQM